MWTRADQALLGGVLIALAAAACSSGVPGPETLPTEQPPNVASVPTPRATAVPTPAPAVLPAEEDVGPAIVAPHPAADLFASLPTGEEQRERLCQRGHTDRIAQAICGESPASITGLVDLQAALGIAYQKPKLHVTENVSGNARAGNPAFVFIGHTTSLTARMVSPINPRAIVFTPPVHTARSANLTPADFKKDPAFVAMAFTRGEQIVELVDRDAKSGDLRFFVVRFEQACNARPEGCNSYELFTPAIETDWTRVTVYDDSDLENTPADCNVCHQPDGHGTPRKLLMQAIRTPWTHFFRRNRDGGKKQIARYRLAHTEEEAYAGIPGSEILYSDPAQLEGLVENEGFMKQPILLHAQAIVDEIEQKGLKDTPALSLAWQLEYKRGLKGQIPGVGFPVVDFLDTDRLQRAAKAYSAVVAGRAARDKAPYLGDMHREEVLYRVNLAPKPDKDGRGILLNTCRRCHNPTRNQQLSRARFDVDKIDQLPATELDRARKRLVLPIDDPKRMPPARFGRLSDAEVARVTDELTRLIAKKGGVPTGP